MKKIFILCFAAMICFSFYACAKGQEEETTHTAAAPAVTTTTEPAVSTTAPASEDAQKGEELKSTVMQALGNKEGAVIEGNLEYGSFTYKFTRNPEVVYANERTEKLEQKAKNNTEKLIDKIKIYYGDEISFNREYVAPIGNGDNGIDSVQYQYFYVNSQNQQIKIFADSDGVISFVDCNFTW